MEFNGNLVVLKHVRESVRQYEKLVQTLVFHGTRRVRVVHEMRAAEAHQPALEWIAR